jgi:hypothetical protein
VTEDPKRQDLVHIMRPLLFFGEQAGDARHVEAHHGSHRHAAVALRFGGFEAGSAAGLDELFTTEQDLALLLGSASSWVCCATTGHSWVRPTLR